MPVNVDVDLFVVNTLRGFLMYSDNVIRGNYRSLVHRKSLKWTWNVSEDMGQQGHDLVQGLQWHWCHGSLTCVCRHFIRRWQLFFKGEGSVHDRIIFRQNLSECHAWENWTFNHRDSDFGNKDLSSHAGDPSSGFVGHFHRNCSLQWCQKCVSPSVNTFCCVC